MPTCTKFMLAKTDKLHKIDVYLSRFCYDARLDENACGWRARAFKAQVKRETIFTGTKDGHDL